jgi:hypothetical protein
VVDLVPEAYEVVDCGDDGDDRHPVGCGDGDEVDADGEPTELPVVPAMVEDGGDYGDDLDYGLELAEFAGLDGEAFAGGDGAETVDEELAADDDDRDPGMHDAGVVGDEKDEGRGDHELVGQRVEEHAEGGDLGAAASEVAVEAVGDGGEDEDGGGDDLLLTGHALEGGVGREGPYQQRNARNAGQRYGVRQVHVKRRGAERKSRVLPFSHKAGIQEQGLGSRDWGLGELISAP